MMKQILLKVLDDIYLKNLSVKRVGMEKQPTAIYAFKVLQGNASFINRTRKSNYAHNPFYRFHAGNRFVQFPGMESF